MRVLSVVPPCDGCVGESLDTVLGMCLFCSFLVGLFRRDLTQLALFHCMVRYGSVRFSSGRFAFPLQFSTAIEWAGLFTRRYNCAASTAVTSS